MTASSRASPPAQNIYGAALWMAGWLCALTIMAIAGRELSRELSAFQTMFHRSAICVVLTLALWQFSGRPSLATRRLGVHSVRNFVHYGAQFCWFVALGLLPLAEVISIEFTAPAWTALFAAMFLAEKLTPTRVLAIALGFIGVLVIVRPGFAELNYATLIILAAAIGFGVVLAMTKTLSGTEHPVTILFYMHTLQLVLGAGPAVHHWATPSAAIAPWTIVVGVAGFVSHYCLSRAMALADATVVTPLDFLRLPIMFVVGYLLYQEALDLFIFAGASLILAGNFVNVRSESRRR